MLGANSVTKLCELLPKLQGEHRGLFDELETRWFNGKLPGDDVAKRVSRIVPGFRFQGWDGGLLSRVHYSAFAATLDSKAVTDVLRAAETFDNPFPRWVEYRTDFGGCTKPKRARLAIELLSKSWLKVPACLQAQLQAPIKSGLERLSTTHCYCDSKASMHKAWEKNKALIKKLVPEFSPKKLNGNIEKGLSESKFNQECAPG